MSAEPGIQLSAEQQAAICRPVNLIVRAGAGSGKTEVLARRCVALIAGDLGDGTPLDPAAIAAITFTEKAALDMRGRIVAVLAERLARETDAARRTHLVRAERTIGLARISTIHAFCARILRENPIAAGLDPDFEVLDEYESAIFAERVCRDELVKAVAAKDAAALRLVRARRMEDDTPREDALEIIQRMLVEARRRGYPPEWIVTLTERRKKALDEEEDRVVASAQALVDLIDKLLRAKVTGKAAEARDELARAWAEGRARVLALNRSSDARSVEILREIRETLPDARSPLIKDQVTAIRAIVNSAGTKYGLSGELISAWGEYRAAAPAVELAHLIAKAGAAIAEAQRVNRVVTFDDLLIATRDLLRSDREVTERYRHELRAILVDEYQDTNAPQDEIIALLTDPSGAETSEPSLSGRSSQTDSERDSQARSPTLFSRASQTPPPPGRSANAPPGLFIVGDEKQSIYRFRGADVRVFNRPRASAPVELPLAENRRSTPNILNFVNGVAAIAMKAEAGDAAAADYRITWRSEYRLRPTRAVTSDYAVEYIVAIPSPSAVGAAAPKLEVGERRELEAQALAGLIQRIVGAREELIDRATGAARPTEYRDFAILLRAFPDIAIYENALAAAGIPAYTVKGRGFYARREVIDLANLLAAIDDPHDSLALAITLRSPCFGLSDDCLLALGLYLHENGSADGVGSIAELFNRSDSILAARRGLRRPLWRGIERSEVEAAARILRKLRSLRDREPLQVVVEHALELTDYESVMAGLPQSDQRIANLRKLMELARGFDTHRFFTFHDFVAYLRRLIKEEPYEPQAQIPGETDNVVRLMTVHQAKGLEFPIVIIADAGRRPSQENRSPQLDPVNGLLLAATDGSGYDELPHTALERYKKRLKDEEEAEATRILYVALTRARDRLIISEGGGYQGWQKPLRSFIGEERVERFVKSGAARDPIECDGARIMLLRADPDRAPQATRPATIASPTDGVIGALLLNPDRKESPANPDLTLAMRASPWSGGASKTHPDAVERGDQIISPTALADLDRCPRQYWLRHGLGLPEPRFGPRGDGEVAIAMGSVAHAVLESIDFGLDARPSRGMVAQLTAKIGSRAGLTAEHRTMIARDLVRYVESLSRTDTVIGREVPFMLNVSGGASNGWPSPRDAASIETPPPTLSGRASQTPPPTLSGRASQTPPPPALFVRGQIDVALRAGERIVVRDYKYARVAEAPSYQVQMECYVLAIAERFPGVVIVAEIVALRDGPVTIALALPEPAAMRARLARLGEELIAAVRNRDYPKRPANAASCRELGCGYVRRCWND